MNLLLSIKRYPFISIILSLLIIWMTIIQIVFYFESSNKIFLDENGDVVCKASGKYKVIQNPLCKFSANLQGKLFQKNQLQHVQEQIKIRTSIEPILNEKINQTIKEYESKFSDELKVMDTLISDKRNRLKELELEIKNPSPTNDKYRVEYEETLRSISSLEENKASSLKKLLETYQIKINDLRYQISINPMELKKLISLEKIIQNKLK